MKKITSFVLLMLIIHSPIWGQNINLLEYWIDTDQGIGNGTQISVVPSTNIDQSFNINLSGISDGLHVVGVRTRTTGGVWSQTAYSTFFKTTPSSVTPNGSNAIAQMEYFIDTDPSVGNGVVSTHAPSSDGTYTFNVSLSNIADGLHTIGYRAKDVHGVWSQTAYSTFIKTTVTPNGSNAIVQMEYFIDTDPSVGNGIVSTHTPSLDGTYMFNVSLSNTADGLHTIGYRAKDIHGVWSQTAYSTFFKIPCSVELSIDSISHATCNGANGAVSIALSDSLDMVVSWLDDSTATGLERSALAPGTYLVVATHAYTLCADTLKVVIDNAGCIPDSCLTAWIDLVGTTVVNGVTLKKSSTISGWNAGARSKSALPAYTDGWVETRILETNKRRVFGLSKLNTVSDHKLTYGILLENNATAFAYENGAKKGSSVSYAKSDKFRVERVGNTVRYVKNGVVFRTSGVASKTDLYVDASFNSPNATLDKVETSFGCAFDACAGFAVAVDSVKGESCAGASDGIVKVSANRQLVSYNWSDGYTSATGDRLNAAAGKQTVTATHTPTGCEATASVVVPKGVLCYPDSCLVSWTELVGVALNGDTIVKTNATTGWNAGARSAIGLKAGTNGWVSTQVLEVNKSRVFGLSKLNTKSDNKVTYGILLSNSKAVSIVENGVNKGSFGNYVVGDRFAIQRVGDTVSYLKNEVVFYTSTVVSTTSLYADISINNTGGRLYKVYSSFGCEPLYQSKVMAVVSRPVNDTTSELESLLEETNNDEKSFGKVQLYPNPTTSDFVVDYRNCEEAVEVIKLYNAAGKLLRTIEVSADGQSNVSTAELPTGLYIVELNGVKRMKLVKVQP